jgi:hypothetical protein
MRSSKAPALATWLLEHVVPGDRSEALAGDLLEQFGQGRSVAWYWRQVLVAIFLGFWKELHVLWVAAGFTIVWIFAASPRWLIYIFRSRPFQALFGWSVTLKWPARGTFEIATFITLYAVPLFFSLAIYLLARRRLGLRRLALGLSGGLVGIGIGFICWMLIVVHSTFAVNVLASLPLFLGHVLAIWTVQPNRTGRRAARFSI